MTEQVSAESISDILLSEAKKQGAEAADVLVATGMSTSVDVRMGRLELSERAEGIDVGLRVFIGQKQAIVSGSDAKMTSLSAMVERAVAMAKFAPDDPFCGLADPSQFAKEWDVEALDLKDPSAEPDAAVLQEAALAVEASAMSNTQVEQVSDAAASYTKNKVYLQTSNGFTGSYERTSHGISCVAIAGTGLGMERDYDYDGRCHRSDMRSPHEIGALAAQRAVERLNPRKPTTGSYPVLFDERIASSLIGHLLSAVNGSSVARGVSWLRDDLGKQVLPDGMSLNEEPLRARIGSSRPFDAEGLPKRDRAIVDNGILQGWTLNLASARKLAMEPTGNAARAAGSLPTPSVGNLSLTQGTATRSQLIRDMGTGLVVTSLIGSTINPNTGDYSRGASGLWVENGEVAYPVSECTIAGNLCDMLLRVIAANDARDHVSSRVPSLLIEGMHIAGN